MFTIRTLGGMQLDSTGRLLIFLFKMCEHKNEPHGYEAALIDDILRE